MSKLLKFLAVAVIFSSVFAGCGGGLEDTYVQTTLKDAARGDVVSAALKYSFDTPKIIGAAKNVALVREDNIIEFFVGDGIADKAKQVEGKKYTVLARKYFTPYVHFMVDAIVADGDTIAVGETAVKLPNTRPEAQFTPSDEYEVLDPNKLSPSLATLNDIKDKKFRVDEARITWDQIPEGWFYSLNFKNVRFFVEEENDAMLAILDASMKEGKPFKGGVHYVSDPTSMPRDYRERLRSGGKVTIGYVFYGGNACIISM